MRKNTVIISLAVMALAGCSEDKPDDKITSTTIRKYADNDKTEGLEVVNFRRSNGQVVPNSANLYKVTYSYDVRLMKPYAEVVLANAKALQKMWSSNTDRETGAFLDNQKMQNDLERMQVDMAVNAWIKNQGSGYDDRKNIFVGSCDPCRDYWNSTDSPKETRTRRYAFIASWSYFEEFGFKDNSKIGDSIPREAWQSFSKTEKGWIAAN